MFKQSINESIVIPEMKVEIMVNISDLKSLPISGHQKFFLKF